MEHHEFGNRMTAGIYQFLLERPHLRRKLIQELATLDPEYPEDAGWQFGWQIQNHIDDAFDALEARGLSPDMKRLITLIFAEGLRSADFDAIGEALVEELSPEFA